LAQEKKLHPLGVVFIVALALVIVTFTVLYTALGLRYVNDKTHELKFVGRVENGVAVSGKIYYYDGRVGTLDAENKTILFENADKYSGALSGYLPHGKGTLTTAEGTIFEGDFYEGYCTGNATISYKNGDVYIGEVNHSKREGFGKYIKADGTVYEGSFRDGEKNGIGRTAFTDGSVYIGQYKDSIKDGVGAYLFDDSDIYVGEFKEDKRTGKGIYVWSKSEAFTSEFDTLFNVTLDESFVSSFISYFEGDFKNHFKDAEYTEPVTENPFFLSFENVLKRSQIEMYIGDFYENQLTGEGTYRWLSGRVYSGTFKDGVIVEE